MCNEPEAPPTDWNFGQKRSALVADGAGYLVSKPVGTVTPRHNKDLTLAVREAPLQE